MQARSVIVKVALDLGTGGRVTVLTPAAIRRASSQSLKERSQG